MTAYTEEQRVSIRKYVGYPSNFHLQDPSIETAITATQSVADGGSLSSDATQLSILRVVAALDNICLLITNNYCTLGISAVGSEGVKLSSPTAIAVLRMEGKRLVMQLCIPLGLKGYRQDFFGVPDLNTEANPWLVRS